MRTIWTAGLACLLMLNIACASRADDKVMGNWKGTYTDSQGVMHDVRAQIIARANGKYEGYFLVPAEDREMKLPFRANVVDNEVKVEGRADLGSDRGGAVDWYGTIANGEFTGEYKGADTHGSFTLKRVEIQSPTLGAKPPQGAVVLFDGSNLDQWTLPNGEPAPWKIVDGAMEVTPKVVNGRRQSTTIISKQKFEDAKIHVEFRTPFMPEATGQARGNSGVYVQGRYEVQVLDSFGLEPKDNEAGGIYKIAVPKVNASLPPGEWQTYDITFHAPKYEGDTQKEPAEITVVHNGITIHDKVKLTSVTAGGLDADPSKPGPLLLQDHGDPVQFRNIWVLPLDREN